jgi:hypothetical protein
MTVVAAQHQAVVASALASARGRVCGVSTTARTEVA